MAAQVYFINVCRSKCVVIVPRSLTYLFPRVAGIAQVTDAEIAKIIAAVTCATCVHLLAFSIYSLDITRDACNVRACNTQKQK
jgi:hypothetical protein